MEKSATTCNFAVSKPTNKSKNRNKMIDMKTMNLRIWAIAALFLSLAACDPTNPDDPENELSDKAALLRLSFTPTDNPGMSSASTGVLSNGYYCISVINIAIVQIR